MVEPSNGPWSSPNVLVKIKDGTIRFCVDFRKVDDLTKKDAHPRFQGLMIHWIHLVELNGLQHLIMLVGIGKWESSQPIERRQHLPHLIT